MPPHHQHHSNQATSSPCKQRLPIPALLLQSTETVRIYRHVRKTNNPKTGGTRERGTAATGTLATGNAVTITSTHTAPTVSETKRYYYYVCVDTLPDEQNTNNNCSPNTCRSRCPCQTGRSWASVSESCLCTVQNEVPPMGGDAMIVSLNILNDNAVVGNCGTITLGGLETVTGEQGFVASAHVIGRYVLLLTT